MFKQTSLAKAVRLALLTSAASGCIGAASSVAAQDTEVSDQVDEIVVTGSRIARRDNIAESPIFSVDAETIKSSGNVTLDHYLNTLPQITPNISSQSNNPSSGGRAFIDLRGLGASRNLVLFDGRRGMGQSDGGTVVDTNTVPSALVERVEIISGGAAAVYGADAIAGVVNFIMKKDFEGFELNYQYRLSERGDGEEMTTELTLGSNFADGRGNSVFSASYFDRRPMYKDAREFSSQASAATGIFPNGSWSAGSNTPSAAFVEGLFGANKCERSGGSGGWGLNPDGTLFCTGVSGNSARNIVGYKGPESDVATFFAPDRFSYNFEPDNLLVLPLERWNLYTRSSLEVSEQFRPYVQASFTNYSANQELAPTPVGGLSVPVTNPFIPTQLKAGLATRANPTADFSYNKRFKALGGRTGDNTHDVWQIVAGTEGDLTEGWSYDAYGSWGRSVRNEIQGGNVRLNRTEELLDRADGGVGICQGGLNLFGDTPISAACQNYISLQAKNLTVVEQHAAELVINGDLFELPAGTVQSAFGASYREVDFDFLPDSGLQPGLVAGFNEQLPVKGALNYTDIFTEVSVPLLSELPGIDSLSTTLGYRITDNNVFGSDESWKVTFDWSIIEDVRARGGMQHAIRSPNIAELFSPQLNSFPNFANQDPCNFNSSYRTGANGAKVRDLCAAQASVAGSTTFSQPFGQAQAIVGGNPNLEPELADSWSFGFVFTPEFESPLLQRFSATIDYFAIELEDVISSVGTTTIITRCFNAENANPSYSLNNEWCSLFNRDQADGRVIDLKQLSRNQSIWELSGIDVTLNVGTDLGRGSLDLSLLASYLNEWKSQVTSVDKFNDYAGTIGSGTGSSAPELRGTVQLVYGLDDLQLTLSSRYIDSMSHSTLVTNPSASATGTESIWYTDIVGTYDASEGVTLRFGVNNLDDRPPRLYNPNVQANTDPSLYDILGRRFFLGLEWRM